MAIDSRVYLRGEEVFVVEISPRITHVSTYPLDKSSSNIHESMLKSSMTELDRKK